MIGRMQPLAAVTGTYYDIPTAIPVGTICIRGNTVNRGRVGTALAINRKNRAALVSCCPGQRDNWSHYSSVVRAGPPSEKRSLIDEGESPLTVVQQCELLGLSRSTYYYEPAMPAGPRSSSPQQIST